MFDVGFSELVLLFIIGLLVLGPQRLPKVAAEVGKWVGRARRTATQLRRQLEREIELADIQNPPPSTTPPAGAQSSTPPSAVPEQNPFVAADEASATPSADTATTAPPSHSATSAAPAAAASGDDVPVTPSPAASPAEAESKPPQP